MLVGYILHSLTRNFGGTMLHHLVLFKFAEKPTAIQISEMHEALIAMKGKISQIQQIAGGEDINKGRDGFEYGLYVQLENKEALDAYLNHPEHQSVVKKTVNPLNPDIVAVDFVS
jgi:hypothetical protein